MPRMRNVDNSARDAGSQETPGVCELAQVCYRRKRRENWPFKYYTENGRVYQNTVLRRRKPDLTDVEEAPF